MVRVIHAEAMESDWKVAIVASRFNETVVNALYEGAIGRLRELGLQNSQITVTWVPGAIEIPLVAQQYAQLDFDAIICLGAVIRDDTGHYDVVCQQVSYGCQRIALDQGKPVVFGILTTENLEQALERAGGSQGHKGRAAADCAYEMVSVLREIRTRCK